MIKIVKQNKENDVSIEVLRAIHNKDVIELSYHSTISKDALIKWTLSAYQTNKNGNLKIDPTLNTPNDMPKTVYRNNKIH